jgi:hypothetical protein
MPLKIVHIQFEEPSVPFDVASEIFSYAAYPLDEGKRVKFAEAACRWGTYSNQERIQTGNILRS